MKLSNITIQSIVSFLAVVISMIAAFFAWQQVDISRTHNRLSVMPTLQITPFLEGKTGRNGLFLSNDGLGPAFIKSFSVKSGDVVAVGFESDRWAEILATTKADPVCFATAWPRAETTLKAGVDVPLVFATKAEGAEICLLELIKLIGGTPIEIDVVYESIYGDTKHLKASSKIFSKTLDMLHQQLTTKATK